MLHIADGLQPAQCTSQEIHSCQSTQLCDFSQALMQSHPNLSLIFFFKHHLFTFAAPYFCDMTSAILNRKNLCVRGFDYTLIFKKVIKGMGLNQLSDFL